MVNRFTAVVFGESAYARRVCLALVWGVSMAEDTEYYRERARIERIRADEAARANVAAIHAELARMFEAMAEQPELRLGSHASWPASSSPVDPQTASHSARSN